MPFRTNWSFHILHETCALAQVKQLTGEQQALYLERGQATKRFAYRNWVDTPSASRKYLVRDRHFDSLDMQFAITIGGSMKLSYITASLTACVLTLAMSGVPAQAYVAGSANAFRPVYNSAAGGFTFKCAFAGWAGVKVNWTCKLTAPVLNLTLSSKSGSFSNGSANPGPWTVPKQHGITPVCTVAHATYADGSASDSDQKCY
jgi:hypothetical protein